jgi:IS30 family transposase
MRDSGRVVREAEADVIDLKLTRAELRLQDDVATLEWPNDPELQFKIMRRIEDTREETKASQRRIAQVIGWPRKTLGDRLTRFRRSDGVLVASGAHSGQADRFERAAGRIERSTTLTEEEQDALQGALSKVTKIKDQTDMNLVFRTVGARETLFECIKMFEENPSKKYLAVLEEIRDHLHQMTKRLANVVKEVNTGA